MLHRPLHGMPARSVSMPNGCQLHTTSALRRTGGQPTGSPNDIPGMQVVLCRCKLKQACK